MALLKQAEDSLSNVFKGAPKLSDNGKNSLVKAWPWIALVFGVLQLLAAWGLYKLYDYSNNLITGTSNIYTALTGEKLPGYTAMDKTIIFLGILVLLVDAVILLMAYSPLKNRAKRGWDLLFLGSLLNVAYGVISVFIDQRGVGTLLFSLLGSAVGFYLLFQVRDKYRKAE